MSEEIKDLGRLVDCTEKEFRDFCAKQGLGYLMGLKNLIIATYAQTYTITKELVEKGKSMSDEERRDEKFVKTLEGLHSKMMMLDLKYMIITGLIENRSSVSLDKS